MCRMCRCIFVWLQIRPTEIPDEWELDYFGVVGMGLLHSVVDVDVQ